LVLLVAAINIKNHKSCKGIEIEILGVKEIYFLDKNDIMEILASEGLVKPEGKPIADFNLQRLELVLERNVWVRDAELFFDNNLMLHISILEKEPVARIFTNTGNTFYIDSSGSRMPLNTKMNVKLPVFTGFPGNKNQSQIEDSILIKSIKKLTMYILNDKFWMAQIAQVDITPEHNFQLIPTVGNHIIDFGNGDNCESKFKRLLIFYKEVLSQTGMDTYSKISVQYDKQVIGTKKGTITKIDSVQALKNIQKMIEEAKKVSQDSVYAPVEKNMTPMIQPDSMIMDSRIDVDTEVQKESVLRSREVSKPEMAKIKPVTVAKSLKNPAPGKNVNKPVVSQESKLTGNLQKPKAVMSKLNN
jgi:cell division protein FtsQ